MATLTQPVPQWALPFLGNEEEMEKLQLRFNPVWLKWFLDLIKTLQTGGGIDHNTLSGLQGGTAAQFYHLRAPGAAGTIARSDGTNWLASTVLYPASVTAAQVLYGSATNTITGAASLTTDGSALTTGGLISAGGGVDTAAGKILRALSGVPSLPALGKGTEIGFTSVTDSGYINSYDRASSLYKALTVDALSVVLNSSGVAIAAVTSTGIAITGTATATVFNGPHNGTLGATTPSSVVATTISTSGNVSLGVAGTGAANSLTLDGTATGQPFIAFNQNAVQRSFIQWNNAFSYLQLNSAVNVNGALTATIFTGPLNGSLGATTPSSVIATTIQTSGDLTVGTAGTGAANRVILDGAATGQPYISFNQNGSQSATLQYNHADSRLVISTGLYVTGPVKIGNTLNVVSPTAPNRTVTWDVGGTTVYVAAKTTND